MTFHGDDGAGMVTVRRHHGGLRVVITKEDGPDDYDDGMKVTSIEIPKEITDRIRQSILVGDHPDDDPDMDEPDEDEEINVDLEKMMLSDIKEIIKIVSDGYLPAKRL